MELYACEICDNVLCIEDYGRVHLHMCKSCNGGTFHNKIVIQNKKGPWGDVESRFVREGREE